MCGRFNVTDSPEVQKLLQQLRVDPAPMRYSGDVAPGAVISVIRDPGGGRRVSDAIWWLMLDRKTLKPDYRYASFNSRSDKLDSKRSLAYRPYRESRCIIPASAFIEGLGDRKTYHKIELPGRAIAFGGLCKEYIQPETGESTLAASIITLPPLPEWKNIHPKSAPLMLPAEDSAMLDRWLDPEFHDTEAFRQLLEPVLRSEQLVTPIGKPSRWNETGDSFLIRQGEN